MEARHEPIPADWPVQPIPADVAPGAAVRATTCGACGLTWDDGLVTSMTPAPAARCPFEPFHVAQDPEAMSAAEAIAILRDRAERWAEFHEPDPDDCDGYQAAEDSEIDGRTYYGHATCDELDELDKAMDATRALIA